MRAKASVTRATRSSNDPAAAELGERTGEQRPDHEIHAGARIRWNEDIFDFSRRTRSGEPVIPGAQNHAAPLFIIADDASRADKRSGDRPKLGGELPV